MAKSSPRPPIVLQGLPPVAFELLREIPHAPELDNPAAGERLFPPPGDEEALCEDWKSLVEPELQQAFLSARQIVEADLNAAQTEAGGVRLSIPHNHVDAWLSALNQIRLALAAAHALGEAEISNNEIADPSSPQGYALVRIHLFGQLQETLLAALED